MNKKKISILPVIFFVLGIHLLLPASRAYSQQVKSKLSIGVVAPLTGRLSSYGQDIKNGVSLALDVIKTQNPDLGARITTTVRDNRGLVSETSEQAEALVSARKADVFIGTATSITTDALVAEADKLGKPVVAPLAAALNSPASEKGFFSTSLSHRSLGALLAKFAIVNLGKKTALILYDATSQYSTTVGKAFAQEFTRRGGNVLDTLRYTRGDVSFRSQLTKVKKQNPDLVIVPGSYEEAGRIMRQSQQLGLQAPMLGTEVWDSPNLIDLAGKRPVRGHYFVVPFSSEDPDAKVQAFVNAYRRRFAKLPTFAAAVAYDAMLYLAAAFDKAQTNSAGPLINALSRTDKIPGLLGNMQMTRDMMLRPAVIMSTTGSGWRFHSRISPEGIAARRGG